MEKYDPCIYHSVEVLATTKLHFFVPFLLETETVTKIQNKKRETKERLRGNFVPLSNEFS